MADALGSNAVGATGSSLPVEPPYAPWQYVNDIFNIHPELARANVLMATGQPQTADMGQASGAWHTQVTGGTQNQTKTVRDAMMWVRTLPQDQLSNFTSAMYAAGYYPSTTYTKSGKPPSGKVFDDYDQYAALKLYQDVVSYNAANPNTPKSMQDILKDRIDKKVGQSQIDQNAAQTPGQVYKITTDDPATLRASVTKTAQAILGRAVTDDEQNALVEKMLAAEKAPQEAVIGAGETAQTGSDVRLATAQVDAQAQLEEQLKAKHPGEAGAYAELNYYNMLSNMLGGGAATGQTPGQT